MKLWMKKLLDQFEISDSETAEKNSATSMNEERATLLHMIDVISKHSIETDHAPLRKTREILDELAKGIATGNSDQVEKNLFRLRQFYTAHRLEEYTYVQKTFNDFKNIIWDFADQISDDLKFEKKYDLAVKHHLDDLREAVESNSIDSLRSKSREFIDSYMELQNVKDQYRSKKFDQFQNHYSHLKQQLTDAQKTLQEDHLTGAFNRRSFDEQLKNFIRLKSLQPLNITMIALDIDNFKKINDTFGHAIGDFVLIECVKALKAVFNRDQDFVARIGGEEFIVFLPDYKAEHAVTKAEELKARVNREVYVHGEHKLQFTISMGIAELQENEKGDHWLKRADTALYDSKHTGRNKWTISEIPSLKAVG